MLSYLDTAIGFAVVMLGVSLLITILTQMVSALVNHRGGNLLWGITTLFANIDPARYPNLTAQSDSIARLVLTHRLVSDSWFSNNRVAMRIAAKFPVLGKLFSRFQIASAIRPNELTDILRHLSENIFAGQPVAAEIRTLLGSAASATASERASRAASAVAGAPATSGTTAGVPVIQSAVDAVRDTAGRLEDWFNSMMDRVSQKFAVYMRLWTVAFACAFAFGTGLNAPQLLIDLYTNGAVREQLVTTAAPLAATAQSLLAGNPATTPDAIQNALAATYTGALEQALKEANVQTANPPQNIATPGAGRQWIQSNIANAAENASVLAHFETDSQAAARTLMQNRSADAATVQSLLFPGLDPLQIRWYQVRFTWKYFWGVGVTAGLLSLGAPFWFNALKTLSNLRPILARQTSGQETS
jgi:hypothetical protein